MGPERAAIYCRISDDRTGQGLGVERQREDCQRLAERLGWGIGAVYVENDTSAYSGKPRPQYMRLLGDIASGEIDGLAFYRNDRLHRSPAELEAFIDVIDTAGIPLQSVASGTWDLTTASGRLVARVLGAFARSESETMSERIKRKQQELRANGHHLGGRRCFGLTEGRTDLMDYEAALIRKAASDLLAGVSGRRIVAQWNAAGLTTTGGRQWNSTKLRDVMLSEWARGLTTDGTPAQWPTIIDATTAKRLDALYADPTRMSSRPGSKRKLLTGLLYCERCNEPLGARVNNGASSYGHQNPKGCALKIKAAAIDEDVSDRLQARINSYRAVMVTLEAVEPTADESELEGLVQEESDLTEMLGMGQIKAAAYAKAVAIIDQRRAVVLAGVRRDLEVEQDRAARAKAFSMAAKWDTLDVEDQRAVLRAFVERIELRPAPVKGRPTYDPDRVEVTWRKL
jgi:DNA invertase Pin-like site-specific DNA recombinase